MKLKLVIFFSLCLTACAPLTLPPTATPLPPTPTHTLPAPPTATVVPTATTTAIPLPPTPAPILSVVVDNLAVDGQGNVYASGYNAGDSLRHYARWDGTTWTELGQGFQTAGNTLAIDNAGNLYTEALVTSEQGTTTTGIMRWDGQTWADVSQNLSAVVDALQPGRVSANVPVVGLAVDGGGNLYAAGAFYYPTADHRDEVPLGYVAKWDGTTWVALGQGLGPVNVSSLAVSAAGEVYVGGEVFTDTGLRSYLAHWNGETWQPQESGAFEYISRLAVDSAGQLYASGTFQSQLFVAQWTGSTWLTLTEQFEGVVTVVYALVVTKAGEQLYIGGDFAAVAGTAAPYIARWDGTTWQALGTGVNERVQALALGPGGELYAGGYFTQAGEGQADHVAQWDGALWRALTP